MRATDPLKVARSRDKHMFGLLARNDPGIREARGQFLGAERRLHFSLQISSGRGA